MKKILSALSAAAAMTLGASLPAQAAYVVTSEGVNFSIDVTNAAAGQFTLDIDNLLSSTGAWADVTHVFALAFKDIGTNFTIAGSTIAPGTATPSGAELNANGCAGGDSGGICFTFNPLYAASDDMQFLIDLNGSITVGAFGPHLKVNFTNATNTLNTSLLSTNLSTSSTGGGASTSGTVPEPGTGSLALLGLAALGAGFGLRRKQAAPKS